jgi:tRNA(His) guanylyltransferase
MDNLGDRMKRYEFDYSHVVLPRDSYIVARVDGRAFHAFTSGLQKPYDENLSNLMIQTAAHLAVEFNAALTYTQSDEISLLWPPREGGSEMMFGGKRDKIVSLVAAQATAFFGRGVPEILPAKAGSLATFDCRVHSLPSEPEVTSYFAWRETDSVRNSIQSAAQSVFSHRVLHGKGSAEMIEMLREEGVTWKNYPSFFRRGTYIKRTKRSTVFTPEDVESLPLKHEARTNGFVEVERWVSEVIENGSAMDSPGKLGLFTRKEYAT